LHKNGILRIAVMLVLICSLALVGCGQESATVGTVDGKVRVTATTGMIADLVQNVGGEHVDVQALMGPGVDPHLYKASQGDIAKMEQAQVVFYNGLHLEGKMTEVFEQVGKQKPAIAVTEKIPQEKLHHPPAFDGQADPHVWFDVQLWMFAMERVRDGLIQVDPAHKADYENAAAYRKQLEEVDRYAREQIASIPKETRVLVTAHDAFGYFGSAYVLEVQGLQGISTDSEYGLKDVQDLVGQLTERKIKAVFIESSVPKRAIEAVVEGAKAKGHEVKIGGELFSDAMGDTGTPEGTYVGMVRHNVDVIVAALK
jgi:manganese/zinc/iron transport system substrate-binding protein